jgi:hypothetical protein
MFYLYISIILINRLNKEMAPQKQNPILVIGGVPMTRGQLDGKWFTGPPVKKPAPSVKTKDIAAPNPAIKESTRVSKTACKALERKKTVCKVSALNETSCMIPVCKVSAINEATPPIEKHKESIASDASGNSLDALKAYESPGKQGKSLVPGYDTE